MVSNEFFTIAWTFPRRIHKVIIVEYVVVVSLKKWLASPMPIKVGAVVATRRLAEALQEDVVPKYITYPASVSPFPYPLISLVNAHHTP